MPQTVIVKLMRPSEGPGPWLVANHSRTLNRYIEPATIPAGVHRVMRDKTIGYFDAAVDDDGGRVVFGQQAKDQPW